MSELVMEQPEFEFDFVATFIDGEPVVYRTPDEFFSFKELDKTRLKSFGWVSKANPAMSTFVDITDGSFEIGGLKIDINLGLTKDDNGNIRSVDNSELVFEPIWFRRIRKVFGGNGETTVKYCIGWKTKFDDRVHQKILLVDNNSVCLSDSK